MNLDFKNPAIQKIALSALLSVGVLAIFFATHYLPFGFLPQKERALSPTNASAAASCDFAIGVARLFSLVSAR